MNQMIKDFKKGKISYDDLINPEVMAKYALKDPAYANFLYTYEIELRRKVHKATTEGEINAINFLHKRYDHAVEIFTNELTRELFSSRVDEEGR